MFNVAEAKAKFSELVNRAAYRGERIVVGSRDKPKVAIISIEDLERLEDLEDAQAADEAVAEYERGETIPWEQVKAELGLTDLDLDQARKEDKDDGHEPVSD